MPKPVVLGIFVAAMFHGPLLSPAAAQRNSGLSDVCGTFTPAIDFIFFEIAIPLASRPDEGWAYVDRNQKIQQATGIAENVRVAANDMPSNHRSHDLDFNVRLDPGQEHLLSVVNGDTLPVEWETGIHPSEKRGDGLHPIFPKWAWPSDGDRVWVNGNWIHDCGHPDKEGIFPFITYRYRAEIHPARAIASMRDVAAPLDGTGLTPVPATRTDLFISGNGGFAPNQLNCGPDIILGDYGTTCGQATPPADTSYRTTPINDTDFTFAVCLPPRPSADAVPMHRVDLGPGNTVGIAPVLEFIAAAGYCRDDARYDPDTMMRVTVPLNGTATPPTAVYARQIYAGWLVPPAEPLPRRRVTIDATDLHQDHDLDPGDGELTFWWVNLNRADTAWLRLSDFANGNMNDYDDDDLAGDGIMSFTGAAFDFYLRRGQDFRGQELPGQDFAVRSIGFEQDCYDNIANGAFFGRHVIDNWTLAMIVNCNLDVVDHAAGDPIAKADETFTLADLGAREVRGTRSPFPPLETSDYELELTIEELPPGLEDTSYLSIQTACTPLGEVALAGQPLTCTARVNNAGVGLPRRVEIANRFSGPALATVNGATWAIREPFGRGMHPCTASGSGAVCQPHSVPVIAGTGVTVTTTATPSAPGLLNGRAEVTTVSTDPDLTDNVATTSLEVYRSVTIDVSPGNSASEVNLGRRSVTVAIVTTPDFDAASVDPASVCFGDAGAPSERTCAELHGRGHLEDVNRDRRRDLVLHFAVDATGIDVNDTAACLTARTAAGVGLYGCAAIVTRPPE